MPFYDLSLEFMQGDPLREGPTGVSNSVVKDKIGKRTMDG